MCDVTSAVYNADVTFSCEVCHLQVIINIWVDSSEEIVLKLKVGKEKENTPKSRVFYKKEIMKCENIIFIYYKTLIFHREKKDAEHIFL